MSSDGSTRLECVQKEMGLFVRRIKQQEEEHSRMFEYCNGIILRKQQISDDIYIHDQIIKIRNYIKEKSTLFSNHLEQDNTLSSTHLLADIKTIPPSIFKKTLLKIIEVLTSAVESLKEPTDYYSWHWLRLKGKLMATNSLENNHVKFSQIANSLSLSEMTKSISSYLQHKSNVQIERLRQLITYLEQSDHQGMEDLRQLYYKRLRLKESKRYQQSQSLSNHQKAQTNDSIIRNIYSERDIKVVQRPKLIKYEEKKGHRKLQLRRLKKYVQSLYEVMQISKDQLLEDITSSSKEWQSKRLYTQLSTRNKHNVTQINHFVDRASTFDHSHSIRCDPSTTPDHYSTFNQQKLPSYCTSQKIVILEDELVQKQLRSLKICNQNRDESPGVYKSMSKKEIQWQRKQVLKMKNRLLNKKQRLPVANIQEGVEHRIKDIFKSETYADSHDFIEIDLKQHQIRQRLPDIYNRASSVDNKVLKKHSIHPFNQNDKNALQLNKKQFLITQEINFKKPNRAEHATRNSLGQKSSVKNKHRNHQQETKGRQKMENKIKLQLRTMGSNFFQEIGKKISKFCEMKKNVDC